MEASSSSKVTVEYHDPAGVFPLVSQEIQSRLPLRNLNWHSPPRPLRQIRSLHVDFVPDKETENSLRPPSVGGNSDTQTSLEIVRGGIDQRQNAVKERRHQIPGLKTSPYLKIYVLRCDDKEGYKDAERKRIREWIRESALPQGKRENHDAFEWMVLHVVIPDTIAASEPRWRESSTKDSDELKERKSGGAKWPGKGNRTVFDRLRADFNDGKSGHDRIAQIRLVKDRVPPDLLPTPAIATTLEESTQERENAWNDLITKFKTLILDPFDRRVRQYEADIAEQESRRSLPGWNFCTFFIHKEGLAKALESIGLVEDALAIYDELSLGLDTIIRMIASGEAQGTATSFAPYTDDIRDRIAGQPGAHTNGTSNETTKDTHDAIALFSKDYREKIVRSDISIFDFICYIFLRQKALILRLANTRGARLELDANSRQDGGEDLVLTSEVCWRASSFIHDATRTLRQDLRSSLAGKDATSSNAVVESIVCCWTYAVAGLVLEETAVPVFLDITKFESTEKAQFVNGKPKRPASNMALGANPYPQRTTSLTIRKADVAEIMRQPSRPPPTNDGARHSTSSEGDPISYPGLPGQAELATYRAELIITQRKMLEKLAGRRRWFGGWTSIEQKRLSEAKDVERSQGTEAKSSAPNQTGLETLDLLSPGLKVTLRSEAAFQLKYERLTNLAIRHYFAATQSKSAEALIGDLAILKRQQGNNGAAATYFEHILPLYATDSWNMMEAKALNQYAHCLRDLHRDQEYVDTVLKVAARICERKMQPQLPRLRSVANLSISGGDLPDALGMLQDLVSYSERLTHPISNPLARYFGDVEVVCEIIHVSDADTSFVYLNVRHVLDDSLAVDSVTARMVCVEDESQIVFFASSGPVLLQPGHNRIELESRTVTSGAHAVDQISIYAKQLTFVENLRAKKETRSLSSIVEHSSPGEETIPSVSDKMIYLYPSQKAFNATVTPSNSIRIDKPRSLDITLSSGWNEVLTATLRVKSLSAGLRLHLGDATPEGLRTSQSDNGKPSELSLGPFGPDQEVRVTIPYTIEQTALHFAVRIEVHYETSHGQFEFRSSAKLIHDLPLDVDVNDIFHLDSLFSNFTVRTTSRLPVMVVEADLADSPVYLVHAPPALSLPLTVFPSQPLQLLYKVSKKQSPDGRVLKKDAALALRVRYLPVDVIMQHSLYTAFTKDLELSDFKSFTRFLTPLLLSRAASLTNPADLEVVALLREARVPSYAAVCWQETMSALPESIRGPLLDWLQQWHAKYTTIALNNFTGMEAATRQMTISVDVPNVDVVFNTALELPDIGGASDRLPSVIAVGQPVKAVLRIRHTSKWGSKSTFPHVPSVQIQRDDDSGPGFVFDVSANTESWLIGGTRHARFALKDIIELTFDLLLIPLQQGRLALPHVEVQVEATSQDAGDQTANAPALTCETHFASAGQLVEVVREMRTSRVHILEPPTSLALPSSRPSTPSTKEAG